MKGFLHWFVALALPAVCLLSAGCEGPIYHPGLQYFPDAISSRDKWVASGTLTDPNKAIDGDLGTAAIAPAGYDTASLVIDLGKLCLLNMIVIDHGADEFGYCRRLAVDTSDDGVQWIRRATVPGLRRVTNVVLTSQVLARYIRLQAVQPGARAWSVAEVYLN